MHVFVRRSVSKTQNSDKTDRGILKGIYLQFTARESMTKALLERNKLVTNNQPEDDYVCASH